MEKKIILWTVLALLVQVSGVNNTWAAEADPIPLIIIPPGGNNGGGDEGGDGTGGNSGPKSPAGDVNIQNSHITVRGKQLKLQSDTQIDKNFIFQNR